MYFTNDSYKLKITCIHILKGETYSCSWDIEKRVEIKKGIVTYLRLFNGNSNCKP